MKKYIRAILIMVMLFFCVGCSSDGNGNTDYSANEIYDIASKCVVEIRTKDNNNEELSLGSGFVYREDGIIATNYHVIEGATSAIVKLNNLEYPVNSVCAYDIDKDLAFLKIGASNLQTLKLSKRELIVGDSVYTLGSSKGLILTFADGIITSVDREIDGVKYIQHNADISSGNSGSPLLNKYCEVVGINTMTIKESQNLNFAIANIEIESLSFSEELTLYQVYKKECDVLEKLKDLIISKDVDGVSDDGEYIAFFESIKLEDGDAVVFATYNYIDGDIDVGMLYTGGYYIKMTIKEISTSYDYILYSSTYSNVLKGKIYANIFTKDVVKLSYSYTNMSSKNLIDSYRKLGSTMMHLVLINLNSVIIDNNIGSGVSALGFIKYM